MMDMSREKRISLMTQEGPVTVRYMTGGRANKEEIIRDLNEKKHLEQCGKLLEPGASDRVILICDTIRQGLDACHTVVDLLALMHQNDSEVTTDLDCDTDEELELFFRDLDIDLGTEQEGSDGRIRSGRNDDDEDEAYEGNPLERLCSDRNQFVIYSEKELDHGACNDLGESSEKAMMMMQKKPALLPQAAASILVKCDGITALSDETLDLVLELGEKPVILIVPRTKINHVKINRLLFEGSFEIIETAAPSVEYLSNQFRERIRTEGMRVDDSADVENVIRSLKKERGDVFGERDILFLAKAVQKKHIKEANGTSKVSEIVIPRYNRGKTSGKKLLDQIVGLNDVKETLEMEINRQAYRNRLMEELSRSGQEVEDYVPCRNMAFCGNPGTCKTTMARAMAVRMGEMGVTNGTFLEVGREQLIGRYMGETSMKVAKVFEQAKGGVLFIDEAGSLATDGWDHYAVEAVSAIVRHMENDRETVVIFATYNDDMQKLMETNEGLRSRIGRMIPFPDYTAEQLTEIFRSMAKARGYVLEQGTDEVLERYFKKAMKRNDFGGGREARRLLDQAEGKLANFAMGQNLSGSQLFLMTGQIIEEAAQNLLGEVKEKETRRPIGFAPKTVVR